MTTAFVDVHCHLDYKDFDLDRKELIEKLEQENILSITNTINFENYLYTKEIYKNCPNIFVIPGLYPQECEKITDLEFEKYLNFLREKKDEFLAIGEVGLDAHNTENENLLKVQEEKFRKIIDLAIEIDKPLIIHTRKQEEKVLNIIEEYIERKNFKKFHLHCFMGKKKLIKKIFELGIFVSIPMIILNNSCFENLVKEIPISKILVETDSPFLHPKRERNTPLNVPKIYEKIAQVKGLDKNEVKQIIFKNCQNLFFN